MKIEIMKSFRLFSRSWIFVLFLILCSVQCSTDKEPILVLNGGEHIAIIGNNLCSRMLNYGHFETALHTRVQNSQLYIRNMCDGGDTPGFRPHSGRNDPWAFPGAEKFQTANARPSGSDGHLAYPDERLTTHKADIILAFFGFPESFKDDADLDLFSQELSAFVEHSKSQQYNGTSAPQLVLVSPIAFEDLSDKYDLPDGTSENKLLAQYAEVIRDVAKSNDIAYIDVFGPSKKWFNGPDDLTIDGIQLNDEGYQKLASFLADRLVGNANERLDRDELVYRAVMEKNWFWHNDFKIPNGVHVFGRRFDPFGPDNYPYELAKIREMTAIRDTAIWMACRGEVMDLAAADAKTSVLPEVETNFQPGDYGRGLGEYLYGDDALKTITVPDGYKIELFASEQDFPDLANPVQLSFDNIGRLWVATMPTYPHWKPGDPRPNDKLIILEDVDNDGKADKQTTFAEGLHIPVGFEFAPEGVYISQGTNLKLLIDEDGDDRADRTEIILSGFDDHDTHHVISAFCADPSGAIYMGEGVFLHTNVETAYGTVRATNGGFYRYNPQRKHLERTAQLAIPNPWGIAFDDWGQPIFAETSGPAVRWMLPGTVKSLYGVASHKSFDLIQDEHKVRPTSGLEFVSSRHFPDEVQGDLLICNSIGFLGMKQHQFTDDGTGYRTDLRQDLMVSSDKNFRPVDMEFAPDGSLYVVDWHNVLIGHMQHNARDPYRDHVHGRIYRITYPSRPLLDPPTIDGAPIADLLDLLKVPEYRTRYRARRELRSHNFQEVRAALDSWLNDLDKSDPEYEHHLTEALWVVWGLNEVDPDLLDQLMKAENFRARAAAVRYLRYMGHRLNNANEYFKTAAQDPNGRVRLEAIVAASWMGQEEGMEILSIAGQHPLDDWMVHAHQTAIAHLNGEALKSSKKTEVVANHLEGAEFEQFMRGKEIYERDGYCGTCHQPDGKGLTASGFPPLSGTKWVLENEERLIKLTLKGIYGPITVLDKEYPGTVPMTPYEGLLNDKEIADVLSFVRNSFGNKASLIDEETVARVRASLDENQGFFSPEQLLSQHPHQESL